MEKNCGTCNNWDLLFLECKINRLGVVPICQKPDYVLWERRGLKEIVLVK